MSKKTKLTVVAAEAGLPKSLDVELAKRSKPIQDISERVRRLNFSYDDLVLFCATQIFLGDILAKERPDFLRTKIDAIKAKPVVESKAKRVAHLAVVRKAATEANEKRADDFDTTVKDRVVKRLNEKPGLKPKHLVKEIMADIESDTNDIREARATGRPIAAVKLRVPRKNKKWEPYAKDTVADKVSEILDSLSV